MALDTTDRARRLFVQVADPCHLLDDLKKPAGGFVPTRLHLDLGERILLGVTVGEGALAVEVPVYVAARKMPKHGRGAQEIGVVVKLDGDDGGTPSGLIPAA